MQKSGMNCWTGCLKKCVVKNDLLTERYKNGGMETMKRHLMGAVALLLVLMMTACGGSDSQEPAREEKVTDSATLTEAETADSGSGDDASGDSDSAVLSPEFQKTMDDYEAWFDHYCEVMKKYQENPSDAELLSEMTDLLAEETTMLEQMENMDQSEMNSAELAYYIEVTARIEKKLLEVANY